MGNKRKERQAFSTERSPKQPELELMVAIDKCAVFKGQLDCLRALDNIGRAADGRIRVALLVTDMDYSEKTDYRDPAHIKIPLKKSNTGFSFAKYLLNNQSDTRIIETQAFKHFIDVFKTDVLEKELLGGANLGLFQVIESTILSRNAIETFPLADIPDGHALERFKGLSSSALYEMSKDIRKGAYQTMKRIEGDDKLTARGIHSVDDVSFGRAKAYISAATPATALQILHDSPSVYHIVIRTSKAFNEAKNNAGEKSVFEAWDTLQKNLVKMPAAERRAFGKKIAVCYVSNDADALDLLNEARNSMDTTPAIREFIPLRVVHANSFVKLLKGIADDLSVPQTRKSNKILIEELREAKSALSEKMFHGKPNYLSYADEGLPRDADIRKLFVDSVGDSFKKDKYR